MLFYQIRFRIQCGLDIPICSCCYFSTATSMCVYTMDILYSLLVRIRHLSLSLSLTPQYISSRFCISMTSKCSFEHVHDITISAVFTTIAFCKFEWKKSHIQCIFHSKSFLFGWWHDDIDSQQCTNYMHCICFRYFVFFRFS